MRQFRVEAQHRDDGEPAEAVERMQARAGRVLGLAPVAALESASAFARKRFRLEPARALFAGNAAHSMLPLERRPTSALDATIDTVRDRFGTDAITRGVLLGRGRRDPLPLLPD